MAFNVEVLPPGNESEWDEFVLRHHGASFCHLAAWRDVIQRAYDLPCYYLILRANLRVLGILPLVHLKGPIAPNRLVSMPFLDQGGALSASPDATKELLEAATDLACRVNAKGLDLRSELPGTGLPPARPRRVRFLLPLTESEEELFRMVGPKVRNQIRKSEKGGLHSKAVGTSDLPCFYRIFSRNMRDLGSPTHSIQFFESLARGMPKRFRLYLTYDEDNTPVAAAIAIGFRETVTVPWASSLRSARTNCPNHSLYWRVLRDARQEGARSFDFGRSTEGTGTFHFKKQWGAAAVPLVWTFLDTLQNPQSDYYLSPKGNSSLSAIWRKLPLPLTLWLGPVIRRQLPN